MIDADRHLLLEGIRNFRDYGGYAVAGGGQLRRGLLFRSAQHGRASDADLDVVAGLQLAVIIDLRGPRERAASPSRRPAGSTAAVLYVDADTTGLAPHVEAARGARDPDAARAAMARGYAELPFRPRLVPILARYFEALADYDGPSLIHCMAGKDRTGIAVALLHAMLGVHRDDWMADYMLTNRAGLFEDGGLLEPEIDDPTRRVLMGVDPSYLDAAFAAMFAQHGSVDAYLRDVLGVDRARYEAIAARLIA